MQKQHERQDPTEIARLLVLLQYPTSEIEQVLREQYGCSLEQAYELVTQLNASLHN